MNEVNRYLIRLTKWTGLALAIFVTLSVVAKAQVDEASYRMDSDTRNPGNDKQCLSYEECPNWDGNPDTKVFYDLMKGQNGTGKVETDFNYNLHVYLCYINKELDSINGEGAFEKLAILSAKDGMIPCPINVNPHWTYDWELHILKAKLKRLTMLWPKNADQDLYGPTPQGQLAPLDKND